MARSTSRRAASSSQAEMPSKPPIATTTSSTVKNQVETAVFNSQMPGKTSIPASSAMTGSRKRKLAAFNGSDAVTPPYSSPRGKTLSSRLDTAFQANEDDTPTEGKKKQKKPQEEKRLRITRKQPPKSFLEKLERAQTQRMIVIGRTRHEVDGHPTEEIDVVGSTGNIYRVTIDKEPSCTCPDSRKGNECKHKVYALHTVLKAPDRLQYQLALLSSELREIFEGAPAIPSETVEAEDKDGKRKPTDGECPICYMDLEEKENELVWCKAACGNNMHKSCFEQWTASQRGNTVKCVYCRTPWEMEKEDIEKIKKMGSLNSEGYINVADHFGMSSMRDYSSYHQPWVRRTLGMGW